ncbi:MAG: hypothetical protein H7843_10180 [Nitrospirota bacterium]
MNKSVPFLHNFKDMNSRFRRDDSRGKVGMTAESRFPQSTIPVLQDVVDAGQCIILRLISGTPTFPIENKLQKYRMRYPWIKETVDTNDWLAWEDRSLQILLPDVQREPVETIDINAWLAWEDRNEPISLPDVQREPEQEFIPSQELVDLVIKNMREPSSEIKELFESLLNLEESRNDEMVSKELLESLEKLEENHNDEMVLKELSEDFSIKELITEQVEALWISIAKRESSGETVKISQGNRFTPKISFEIIDRLELDPHDLRRFFEQLYYELKVYVINTKPERIWGKITYNQSEFKLDVKHGAFESLNIDDIDE